MLKVEAIATIIEYESSLLAAKLPALSDVNGITEPAEAPAEDLEGRAEKKLGKIDVIFDDLLDTVKDKPEAEQEALKILIGQMRQSAEAMKELSDMEHLQEMKEAMFENWQRLKEAAGEDPALLAAIQQWGGKICCRRCDLS